MKQHTNTNKVNTDPINDFTKKSYKNLINVINKSLFFLLYQFICFLVHQVRNLHNINHNCSEFQLCNFSDQYFF